MASADLGELRQTQTKCFEARKQRVGSFFSIILGNQQPGTTQVSPGGRVEGQYAGGHFFRRELLAMAEISARTVSKKAPPPSSARGAFRGGHSERWFPLTKPFFQPAVESALLPLRRTPH
jgi:hypothetical protein